MALFGGLGKKLGLGSARDIFGDGIGGLVEGVGDTINEALPVIGAAVGFAYGGPKGAALGSSLGTYAQGGNSTKDILTNAALAYGAATIAPSFGIESQGANFGQGGIGSYLPDTSGFTINPFSGGTSASAGMSPADALVTGDPGMSQIAGDVASATSGGIGDFLSGVSLTDAALYGSLGLSALGLMGGTPEEDGGGSGTQRPYPTGEAFGTVQDQEGTVYEIADPVQMAEYNEMMRKYQDPDFRYNTDDVVVSAKNGGSFDDFVDGEVKGPGTGTSDSVPAKLSDGEFVLTAKSVRGAGGGDRDIGAARLYDMMADLEATA